MPASCSDATRKKAASANRWKPRHGPAACLSSYVLLPLAKIYKPIWDYDAKTLGKDFSAHLAYGVVTGIAFSAIAPTAVSGRPKKGLGLGRPDRR